MKVNQVASILNDIFDEVTGESALIKEDLSNFVDVGRPITDIFGEDTADVDNYVKSIIDKVGKVVFSEPETGVENLGIVADSWQYGSMLEKVRADVGDYAENDAWQLVAGQSYDYTEFNPPTVDAKYFNSSTTFELEMSIAREQVKSAFKNAMNVNRFFSMIENRIRYKKNIAINEMQYRVIVNLIAEKFKSLNGYLNLLELYITETGDTTVTASNWKTSKDFLKFCFVKLSLYIKLLSKPKMLYNDGGYVTNTPESKLNFILLTDFAAASKAYLQADTYNNEFVTLKGYHEVSEWQGGGEDDSYTNRSTVYATPASGGDDDIVTLRQDNIIGIMFDREAAAICNQNDRTLAAPYNPKGEFTNYYYKFDCSYFNDTNENCLVFYIDDYSPVAAEPSDWATKYTDYFMKNPATGAYSAVTGQTAPDFDEARYYKKLVPAA